MNRLARHIHMILLLILAGLLLCAFSIQGECHPPDDDEDDLPGGDSVINDDDDDTYLPPDDDDDTGSPDDDDDTGDDDDDDSVSPVISNAYWDPDPVVEDPDDGWVSRLTFSACDPQATVEGGWICLYEPGAASSLDCFRWGMVEGGFPEIPNCDAPLQVAVPLGFDSMIGLADQVCIDLIVQDGDLNQSNRLTDICVYVP